MQPSVISIGEVLFDVFGQVELLAGAPLNVSAHMHRLGLSVGFVSAVGTDPAGDSALKGIAALGLSVRWVGRLPEPTGRVQVLIADGEPRYDIKRGVAYEKIALSADVLAGLVEAHPCWVYFGTLAQSFPATRETTEALFTSLPNASRFYDLNLRTGFDSPDLVLELLEEADVAKLNHLELQRIISVCGWRTGSEEEACRRMADRFGLRTVCVTRGEKGAGLLNHGRYVELPAPRIEVVDTVGAGDAFAAALLHGLSQDWEPERIVKFGNALGSLVASRRGAIPEITSDHLRSLLNT